MKPADPFSRPLPALVQEANGVVAQLGLLEPEEVAALQAAGVAATTASEKLRALATAGEAALRRSALLRGRLAVARLEVRELAAEGYRWIMAARRSISHARDTEVDATTSVLLTAARAALRTRNNRSPAVLADLDRVTPLLAGTLATLLNGTEAGRIRVALSAAIPAAALATDQLHAATREAERVRLDLRAELWRVIPRWKRAADQGGARAVMVQACFARPRRSARAREAAEAKPMKDLLEEPVWASE